MAEQVVEGPVLKHHRHDMIESRTAIYSSHRSTSMLTPRQLPEGPQVSSLIFPP